MEKIEKIIIASSAKDFVFGGENSWKKNLIAVERLWKNDKRMYQPVLQMTGILGENSWKKNLISDERLWKKDK